MKFVSEMDEYIRQLPDLLFVPTDYIFGRFKADREWIRARFRAYSGDPVKQRLSMTADDIYERFQSENIMEEDLPRRGTILKSLNSMLTIKNSFALYRAFYKWLGRPELFVMPSKKPPAGT